MDEWEEGREMTDLERQIKRIEMIRKSIESLLKNTVGCTQADCVTALSETLTYQFFTCGAPLEKLQEIISLSYKGHEKNKKGRGKARKRGAGYTRENMDRRIKEWDIKTREKGADDRN